MTINRENIAEHLLDYQLAMIGKTRVDMIDSPNWRFYFTMTSEQIEEFKKYSINILQKVFKFNKSKAVSTFNWYWKMFGLRVKN